MNSIKSPGTTNMHSNRTQKPVRTPSAGVSEARPEDVVTPPHKIPNTDHLKGTPPYLERSALADLDNKSNIVVLFLIDKIVYCYLSSFPESK